MTQMQTEQLSHEEYCHMLAYGDPKRTDEIASVPADMYANDPQFFTDIDDWISTLDSTTYPGMTFGYNAAPCMSTAVC